jgi:hypothetical protein
MSHHDGGFFTHWGFGFVHWSLGILFWIGFIILAVVLIRAITKTNKGW